MHVCEKGQEGSRRASVVLDPVGLDVPEEDPEMSASQWETQEKQAGQRGALISTGFFWFVDFDFKLGKTAGDWRNLRLLTQ